MTHATLLWSIWQALLGEFRFAWVESSFKKTGMGSAWVASSRAFFTTTLSGASGEPPTSTTSGASGSSLGLKHPQTIRPSCWGRWNRLAFQLGVDLVSGVRLDSHESHLPDPLLR